MFLTTVKNVANVWMMKKRMKIVRTIICVKIAYSFSTQKAGGNLKVILEDTRNKPEKNKHIRLQLEALGYKVERSKLYCGDYSWTTNQSICVDTKKDMNEIESNLIHDHERFRAECIRAKEAGIKLIILIQDPKIKELNDVFSWYNVRKNWSPKATNGRTLAKIMYSMSREYGVTFHFCKKDEVGKRIVELLGGD